MLCEQQRSTLWHTVDEGLCDRGTKPAADEMCGMEKCRELSYDVSYFDSESLVSGTASTKELAAGQFAFYSFEKPNAATKGVCIVAQSFEPTRRKCSVEAERRVSACNSGLVGCLHAAQASQGFGANETTVPVYERVSACHIQHVTCVSMDICNDRVEAAVDATISQCRFAMVALGKLLPNSPLGDEDPYCRPNATELQAKAAPPLKRELMLRVAKAGRSADDPITRFDPPTGPLSTDWESQSPDRSGEQRMVIWESDGYDDQADRILVGLQAAQAALFSRLRI